MAMKNMFYWPAPYTIIFLTLRHAFFRSKLSDRVSYTIFALLVVSIIAALITRLAGFLFSNLRYPYAAISFGASASFVLWIFITTIEATIRSQKIFSFALMSQVASKNFVLIHHTIGAVMTLSFVGISLSKVGIGNALVSVLTIGLFFGFVGLLRAAFVIAPNTFFSKSGEPRASYANWLPKFRPISTIIQYLKANPFNAANIVVVIAISIAALFATIYFKSAQIAVLALMSALIFIQLSQYGITANNMVRDFAFLRTPNQFFIHDFLRFALPQLALLLVAILVNFFENKPDLLAIVVGSLLMNLWFSWIWLLGCNRMGKSLASANLMASIIAVAVLAAAFAPLGVVAAIYLAVAAYQKQSTDFWGKL